MHTRPDDGPLVRIKREVPLSWLGGLIIGFLLQIGLMYLSIDRLTEANKITNASMLNLTAEVKAFNTSMNGKDLKDGEHDWKIDGLDKRLTIVETKLNTLKKGD